MQKSHQRKCTDRLNTELSQAHGAMMRKMMVLIARLGGHWAAHSHLSPLVSSCPPRWVLSATSTHPWSMDWCSALKRNRGTTCVVRLRPLHWRIWHCSVIAVRTRSSPDIRCQWRRQGGQGAQPPIFQECHKQTFKLRLICQFGQFIFLKNH